MPTGEDPSTRYGVVVGLKDIFQLLLEVQSKQSELGGQLGAFMSATNVAAEVASRELQRVDREHADDHMDHERRLRILELRPTISPKAVWSAITVGITLTGVVVAIISLITR